MLSINGKRAMGNVGICESDWKKEKRCAGGREAIRG